MPTIAYSGPNNSTLFTTCCETAICDDQQRCPRCGKDVYPFSENMTEAERNQASGGYYNHNTRTARHSYAGQNTWYRK